MLLAKKTNKPNEEGKHLRTCLKSCKLSTSPYEAGQMLLEGYTVDGQYAASLIDHTNDHVLVTNFVTPSGSVYEVPNDAITYEFSYEELVALVQKEVLPVTVLH